MDPQDLAIKETKNRLKNGILQIDPTDMESIKTLEEIQARATDYNNFLALILEHLEPKYHKLTSCKPIDDIKTPKQQSINSLPNNNSSFVDTKKKTIQMIVQPPETKSQQILKSDKDLNFTQKNSGFQIDPKGSNFKPTTTIQQIQNTQIMQSALIQKNINKFSDSIDNMPPPKIYPKDNKNLYNYGINLSEEEIKADKAETRRVLNISESQNQGNNELILINEQILKNKLEKKFQSQEFSLKNMNTNCLETLNVGFNIFIRNLLTNLGKIAGMEVNSDTLQGFQGEGTKWTNIIENQDLRKTLVEKSGKKNENQTEIKFNLINSSNKLNNQKSLEGIDREDQLFWEEKVKTRKVFEEFEEKISKKAKKINEENKDIYDVLLKNKTEKAKESETKRKEAEDTSYAIDVFAGKSNPNKTMNESKDDFLSKSINKQQKDINKNNDGKKSIEKMRILMKHLIFYLEKEPNYRKSFHLLKAYMKQN